MEKPTDTFRPAEWNLYVSRTREAIAARMRQISNPSLSVSAITSLSQVCSSYQTRQQPVNCEDDEDSVDGASLICRVHGFDILTSSVEPSYIEIMRSIPCMGKGDLVVLVSDYHGLGLFVTRKFRQGDLITTYGGRAVHNEKSVQSDDKLFRIRVPEADYYIDGKKTRETFGRPFPHELKEQLSLSPSQRRTWKSSSSLLWKGIGCVANHSSSRPNVVIKVITVLSGQGNYLYSSLAISCFILFSYECIMHPCTYV
jgi:hypothetical protein